MMKTLLSVLLLFFLSSPLSVIYAQEAKDSVRFREYLPVQHTDALSWIERYEGEVRERRAANDTLSDKSCDILFLGSSSINLWPDLAEDIAPLSFIRRSYGGAALRDMLYNYDVVARGFDPRMIVLYVENDLCGAPEDLTIGETFDFFRIFCNRLQRDYPDTPLLILSMKPSFARIRMLPAQRIINVLLREYAEITPRFYFLDVASCLFDENGELRPELFA